MKDAEIMAKNPNRPLSPHLQVYRWSPQMAISIFHRATGFILATVGMITLLWWLSAIGGGAESYATFQKYVVSAGESATRAWAGFSKAWWRTLAETAPDRDWQYLADDVARCLAASHAEF